MRKVALFDFDKTIRNGYIIFDMIDMLVEHGVLPNRIKDELGTIKQNYSNKKITYHGFAEETVKTYRKIY